VREESAFLKERKEDQNPPSRRQDLPLGDAPIAEKKRAPNLSRKKAPNMQAYETCRKKR
jgi:hypothetical protein